MASFAQLYENLSVGTLGAKVGFKFINWKIASLLLTPSHNSHNFGWKPLLLNHESYSFLQCFLRWPTPFTTVQAFLSLALFWMLPTLMLCRIFFRSLYTSFLHFLVWKFVSKNIILRNFSMDFFFNFKIGRQIFF